MAHIRAQVRAALAGKLTNAAPSGWTVETSRVREVDIGDMPALTLGVRREAAMPDGTCLPEERTLAVEVAAHIAVARESDIEDDLDAAAVWIERAISADPTLGGVARDTIYRGAELEPVTGAERPAGRLTLSFDIRVSAALDTF